MNTTTSLNLQLLNDWPHRVCLPYGIDLLQLARWVDQATEEQGTPRFEIVADGQLHQWSGSDPTSLFSEIQRRCINSDLSHSHILCEKPESIMFFDMYDRFSFFAADLPVVRNLYPFSREVLWEHFALLQEEDDDMQLAEIFQAVHSA